MFPEMLRLLPPTSVQAAARLPEKGWPSSLTEGERVKLSPFVLAAAPVVTSAPTLSAPNFLTVLPH